MTCRQLTFWFIEVPPTLIKQSERPLKTAHEFRISSMTRIKKQDRAPERERASFTGADACVCKVIEAEGPPLPPTRSEQSREREILGDQPRPMTAQRGTSTAPVPLRDRSRVSRRHSLRSSSLPSVMLTSVNFGPTHQPPTARVGTGLRGQNGSGRIRTSLLSSGGR